MCSTIAFPQANPATSLHSASIARTPPQIHSAPQNLTQLFAPTKIGSQNFWNVNASIFTLMVLQKRDKNPWGRYRRIIQSVCKTLPTVFAPVTNIQPPRLKVVQRRTRMSFAVAVSARHPHFDIMLPGLPKAQIASTNGDYAVWEFERLHNLLRIFQQSSMLQKCFSFIRNGYDYLLDFLKLMHAI